ncbi:hypothetical protein KKKH26_01770 [Helicobacter pylori]
MGFKRLSLELGFPLTNIKNAKKDFFIKPPQKRKSLKKKPPNKGFKKNNLKNPQKKESLKKREFKKKRV